MTTPRVTVPVEDWKHVIGALKNAQARLGPGAAVCNVSAALAKVEHLSAAHAPEGGAVSGPGGYLVKDFADGWYWTPNAALDHASGAPVWSVADNRYETDPPALAAREEALAEAGEIFHANLMSHEDNKAWMKLDERAQPQARPTASDIAKFADANMTPEAKIKSDIGQPQAREDAQPVAWYRGDPDGEDLEIGFEVEGLVFDKTVWKPLYATPPAPEAEKLREAATLLDECIWTDHDTGDYRVEHDGSVEKARAILAALQAEQKGGAV